MYSYAGGKEAVGLEGSETGASRERDVENAWKERECADGVSQSGRGDQDG